MKRRLQRRRVEWYLCVIPMQGQEMYTDEYPR